jgi:alginate O-acetyltransferase complex protein AlgI
VSFNSHAFLFLFLPLAWIAFRVASSLRGPRAALGVLVVASLAFYGCASPWHLALLCGSVAFNFLLGLRLSDRWRGRRLPLAIGVGANLAVLGYFKYSGFAVENLNSLCGTRITVEQIAMPLGVSFITFQQIAYLVDCRRRAVAERDLLRYILLVCYFAKIAQGPIARLGEFAPQLAEAATFRFSYERLAGGLALVVLGLFKKVALGDTLASWADAVFDGGGVPPIGGAWIGSLAYTLQIYFDFSGYSDMALGVGRLFGVEVPVNFDSPYRACSLVDFWRRWHITLSSFLRDYLYIPLGGNRRGAPRRFANLFATMLLGGLWHGAAWTFVLWGALHGVGLCLNHAWRAVAARLPHKPPRWLGWPITFLFVNACWVAFRAPSFGRAVEIWRGMIGLGPAAAPSIAPGVPTQELWGVHVDLRVAAIAACGAVVLALPNAWRWAGRRRDWSIASAVGLGALFVAAVVLMTRITEFLYGQF